MAIAVGATTLTDLRIDAVARLTAASTLAGSDVYHKVTPIPDTLSYAIVVSTPGESLESVSANNYSFLVKMRLVLECMASIQETEDLEGAAADEELSRRLDRLVAQALAALFTDPDWRDVWRVPPSVEIVHARGQGRVRLGTASVTITVEDSRRWDRSWDDAATLDTITVEAAMIDPDTDDPYEDVDPIEIPYP